MVLSPAPEPRCCRCRWFYSTQLPRCIQPIGPCWSSHRQPNRQQALRPPRRRPDGTGFVAYYGLFWQTCRRAGAVGGCSAAHHPLVCELQREQSMVATAGRLGWVMYMWVAAQHFLRAALICCRLRQPPGFLFTGYRYYSIPVTHYTRTNFWLVYSFQRPVTWTQRGPVVPV